MFPTLQETGNLPRHTLDGWEGGGFRQDPIPHLRQSLLFIWVRELRYENQTPLAFLLDKSLNWFITTSLTL